MKLLHLSFHKGCQNDIDYVCNNLNIELSFMEFDDGETKNNSKYNIGHKRAEKCWNKYKDYFNTFDGVIVSDTTPISRVFLQNNYKKKLIIWVCNRFDYFDSEHLDCDFPDKEYYNLIKNVKNRKNTFIMGYTPFENFYAKNIKKIDIGNDIIKPIGKVSSLYNNFEETNKENKSNQYFVPPYHNDNIMIKLSEKLNELNIPNYSGKYNGPLDLQRYKGIIHIPYAWSNLALFENLQLGIIYFIPSKKFLLELKKNYKRFFWSRPFREDVIELSEWYLPEHNELFVYFDSWNDLKNKTNTINYSEKKEKIINFSQKHEKKILEKWKKIFY